MLFALICHDKPDHLPLRLRVREEHLAYAARFPLTLAGPLLDLDGQPCGSLLILDCADRAAAEAFAAGDPYAKAGLFASVAIHGHRVVFKDGAAA